MAMVNLAQSDPSEVEEYKPSRYGHGTCIYLTEEQVEMLGLAKDPPKAGQTVGIRAVAKVVRVTSMAEADGEEPAEAAEEGEGPGEVEVSLELQITDMEVTREGQSATGGMEAAAAMLYGG